MVTPKQRLLTILDQCEGIPVLVIGDLIMDHYIWGRVERISPEAPVVVVQVTEENRRPGGAGNVANNLTGLGAKAQVCGIVGDDDVGREMCSVLTGFGALTDGILLDSNRPTTMKTRVIAHAQQVVRVDRETAAPLCAELQSQLASRVTAGLLEARAVIVSDYAKGAVSAAIFSALREHRRRDVPVVVDPKAPHFGIYSDTTVIKPNRKEAESASGQVISSRADAIRAGRILLERWDCQTVMITLGENGMVLVSRDTDPAEAIEIETVARHVYDVSGAGDTVSAVFALALAAGASLREAAELANYAAGVVVAEVGTVAITKAKLVEAIEEY